MGDEKNPEKDFEKEKKKKIEKEPEKQTKKAPKPKKKKKAARGRLWIPAYTTAKDKESGRWMAIVPMGTIRCTSICPELWRLARTAMLIL